MRPIVATLTRLALFTLAAAQLGAAEYNPARTRPAADAEPTVERFIVKLRASSALSVQATTGNGESASTAAAAAAKQRITALASRANVTMKEAHAIGGNLHVMQVSPVTRGEAVTATLARLSADSDVEYVVPDRRVYAHATSNDLLATGQWYLQAPQTNIQQPQSSTTSAINANAAWDVTKGSAGVVIAVIDTGVRFEHPDLMRASQGGRLLPGYDFVSPNSASSFKDANDGDGRDPNASDPGDWIDAADACGDASPSSWHGTRVSGIIGALTNNATGVAGVTWSGYILPVRVLGKCGGFNSDVLAGMNWASGVHIDGIPDNATPAKVLNISLGGQGSCDSASADVTSTLASNGVLIVVSAGNESGPVDSPANCPGAMGIVGLRAAGTKVGFSSLGPEISLAAPGGNCINITQGSPCLFSIDTTSNAGTTRASTSIYTDQLNPNVGTSFSAPIVSGIAGLMLSVNGNLKSTQLIKRMQKGATTPFPTSSENGPVAQCVVPTSTTPAQLECACTTSTCGTGMANAQGAVTEALRPIAAVVRPTGFIGGQNITFQGGGSAAACNHTISSSTGYMWTVVNPSGTRPAIVGANTASATVIAPTSGSFTLRLTVTDDVGQTDSADVDVTSTSATSSAPSNAGSTACLTPLSVLQQIDTVSVASAGTSAFTFTRTGDTTAALTVTISLSGSAINGTDYQIVGASMTFAAGASTATLSLSPTASGSAKTVTVALETGGTYDLGNPTTATVTLPNASQSAFMPNSGGGGGGGGGGGALDALMLMGLALAVLAALARAHLPRRAKQLRQHVATEQRRARH